MNTSDIVSDWLVQKGISHAFGVIGSGNMGLWNAIAHKKEVAIVCCHHEAAAATASDFYNRTAGRLQSICIVTAGAGSSNAVTGVLAAYMDSSPLLILSGQESTGFFRIPHPRVLGVQGYGEIEVARSITKHQGRLMVPCTEGFVRAFMDKAYRKATIGRPGPSWVSFPRDIQSQECD